MSLKAHELEILHDKAHIIRRWTYNPFEMAACTSTNLFNLLCRADEKTLRNCLNKMGLKAKLLPNGKKFSYYRMLKRNLITTKIMMSRRVTYKHYHDLDTIYRTNNIDELKLMERRVIDNENFEITQMEMIIKDINNNNELEIEELSDDLVTSTQPEEQPNISSETMIP